MSKVTSTLGRMCEKCSSTEVYLTKHGCERWCRSKQTEGWLCDNCYRKEYCLTHPQYAEHIKARSRQWQRDNPERHKVASRKWHEANRGHGKFLSKRWRELNAEYSRQWAREYYHRVVKPKKAQERAVL
jgi:hypothetical protein